MLELEKETSALKDKLPEGGPVGAIKLVAFQWEDEVSKTREETIIWSWKLPAYCA